MPVIADLEKPKGTGDLKLEVLTATGPAVDVSVGATSTVEFEISISPELDTVLDAVIDIVTGLPANILVSQVGYSATAITLRAVNPTAAAITITAGSLTIRVLIVGY